MVRTARSTLPEPAGDDAVADVPDEIRKQVSVFVPLSDWRAIHQEAMRLQVPITELMRRWIKPHVAELRKRHG